jgi:hypothetical protein
LESSAAAELNQKERTVLLGLGSACNGPKLVNVGCDLKWKHTRIFIFIFYEL